jgi:hypothetical protein
VNKLRWGKFYWSDWADDPALALCSLAAQGLWMRLLCIAAQGTPYGHVTVNGKPPSVEMLATLVRARPFLVARWIAELERKGVADRGESGCLISRRMVHDGQITAARRAAAEASWRTQHARDSFTTRSRLASNTERNDPSKPAEKADYDPDLHMQTSHFASTESDATENRERKDTESPPKPPQGGRRTRGFNNHPKQSRGAFADMAAEIIADKQDDDRVVPLRRGIT